MEKLKRWTLVLAMGVCGVLPCGLAVWAAPSWKALLKEAKVLERSALRSKRVLAAGKLMQVYKAVPNRFEGLLAATHSCNLRASLSTKKKEMMRWGKRGLAYAETIMKRWPARAEGYFWASVNAGQYARGGGVWVAITKGLAKKIEKLALASYKRNPKLYDGAAQRVLGRYYFRLPWPMRNLDKSLRYLRSAYRINTNHTATLVYLGETLWAKGKRAESRRMMRRCVQNGKHRSTRPWMIKKCRRWLKRHGG